MKNIIKRVNSIPVKGLVPWIAAVVTALTYQKRWP
jgi:hypothetical protein